MQYLFIYIKLFISSLFQFDFISIFSNILDPGQNKLAKQCKELFFVVYTTEPWTLTSLKEIVMNHGINYSFLKLSNNQNETSNNSGSKFYVMATE